MIYYGHPVTDPQQLAKIKAPLLGHFGEADKSIPLAQVKDFNQALTTAGVRHTIYTYPGAAHAFANPTNTDRLQSRRGGEGEQADRGVFEKVSEVGTLASASASCMPRRPTFVPHNIIGTRT